jgi:putative acetyltransferase
MGPADIEIRRARPEDSAAIAAVLREAFAEYKDLYTEGGFAATTPNEEQILRRMQEGPAWVALRDGVVLGTVAAVLKGASSIYIRGMAVLPTARGTGTGTALLRCVEAWSAGQECTRLSLSTTPFLFSAIRLYEKVGFRRTNDDVHDLFGTPLFTMEKTIST